MTKNLAKKVQEILESRIRKQGLFFNVRRRTGEMVDSTRESVCFYVPCTFVRRCRDDLPVFRHMGHHMKILVLQKKNGAASRYLPVVIRRIIISTRARNLKKSSQKEFDI